MKFSEYMARFHPKTSPTRSQCRILGIPFPLVSGWKKKYADNDISDLQREVLLVFISLYKLSGKKRKTAIKNATMSYREKNIKEYAVVAEKKTDNNSSYISSKEFLDGFEWRKLRMEALKLHGARCQCCGISPAQGAVMNVDHIKPRKLFPELALKLSNLQILCSPCNHGKGNWDQTDWRKPLVQE